MTSPFLINLDVVVQYASAPYPNILGPMMVNDYIQGLDPARRLHARKFLNRFQQERPENTYIVAEANRQRLILQHSANNWDGGMSAQAVEGYFHNPRDAPLALSLWIQKWYLGLGRMFKLFDALFSHIKRLKELLIHDGHGLEGVRRIWSGEFEEKILVALCPQIWQAGADAAIEGALRWYRAHVDQYGPTTLDEWFSQQAAVNWPAPAVDAPSPGTMQSQTGVTIPGIVNDQFYESHPKFLEGLCGGKSIFSLISRGFHQSLRMLRELAEQGGGKFDIMRTYDERFEADGFYSPVVCLTPLFQLRETQRDVLDPSMRALRGIALLMPEHNVDTFRYTGLRPMRDRVILDIGMTRDENKINLGWRKEEEFAFGLRCDLARILELGAPRRLLQSYRDTGSNGAMRRMIEMPLHRIGDGPHGFWPPQRPDYGVPLETLEAINEINHRALQWRASIMGGFPRPDLGFQPIDHRSEPHLNQNRAAAVLVARPEAVHPTEVRTSQAIVLKGERPAKRVKIEVKSERDDLASFNSDHRTGGGSPPPSREGVVADEDYSSHLILGLAILVVLTMVTFRKELRT